MRLRLVAASLTIGLVGCAGGATPSMREDALRYVALGDSYTIGTSVSEAESWPSQLVTRVPGLELVANLGVNGYASADLIADELPRLDALAPGFVTVMIGVNDVVRQVSEAAYQANVVLILDALMERLAPEGVLCLATPDYTVTPQGSAFGSADQQRAGIERINVILGEACAARGIRLVPEIFAISQAAATNLTLVAGDGLHPSGAQYALWVEAIAPVIHELLEE